MADYTIEFAADLEMVEGHTHPPVLTTRVRPNLVVDGRYWICAITKTDPPEGIAARSRGSFTAAALCSAEDADRFVAGRTFELRAGPQHIFAKGVFRKVGPREKYHPAP